MPKADKKKSKASKGEAKREKKGKKAGGQTAPAAPVAVAPAGLGEESYSLVEAARRLGKGNRTVEAILRMAHPDDELLAEGIQVSSERILEDGQRLCSKGLIHLESSDPEVKEAARRAGLTRPQLALTVDALLRLAGAVDAYDSSEGKRSDRKQVAVLTIETATAQGRSLKRHTLDRLKLMLAADPDLEALVKRASARADEPEQLSKQLSLLAEAITGVVEHRDAAVRSLAAFKGIEASDATELTAAADAIKRASTTATSGSTRREERQAVLDVLDGLCLLLLDDVLRALRAMARLTTKVHRPRLYGLASYFGARAKGEEEPEAPPAPAPTPA